MRIFIIAQAASGLLHWGLHLLYTFLLLSELINLFAVADAVLDDSNTIIVLYRSQLGLRCH